MLALPAWRMYPGIRITYCMGEQEPTHLLSHMLTMSMCSGLWHSACLLTGSILWTCTHVISYSRLWCTPTLWVLLRTTSVLPYIISPMYICKIQPVSNRTWRWQLATCSWSRPTGVIFKTVLALVNHGPQIQYYSVQFPLPFGNLHMLSVLLGLYRTPCELTC